MKFAELLLNDHLRNAVSELQFDDLTPVQAATIPQFLNHKDVIVEAVTGSGKTLAFLIPIVEIILRRTDRWKPHEIGALILSPTRELALQISTVLEKIIKYSSLTCSCWIGGRAPAMDLEEYNERGAHIIVATPGRCLDLLENHSSKSKYDLRTALRSLEVLVLDEADRLLEMGFKVTLTSVMSYLPKQRRTGIFSATQTTELDQLARVGMRNPVAIKVREKQHLKTPKGLKNFYSVQNPENKLDYLIKFLRAHRQEKFLIFFSTCECVNYFSAFLKVIFKKWTILALHRKLKHKRQAVFKSFSDASSGALVCTDVVARGIDWPDIDWVVQMDVPKSAAVYVHRIGRTARMGGKEGRSLLVLMPNELTYVDFIKINQHVELRPYDEEEIEAAEDLQGGSFDKLRKLALKDKKVYDDSVRAFVSYVRAYGQHECSVICRTKELDLAALAKGFGLLKLPKMPELKECDMSGFQEADVSVEAIPYKDRQKEKARQIRKQKDGEEKEDGKKKPMKKERTEAFSKEKAKRLEVKERKLVKELKRKRKETDMDDDELKELADDMRLIKKLRLKKISREKFHKAFDPLSDEDAE